MAQLGFKKLAKNLFLTSGLIAGSLGTASALAIDALHPSQTPIARSTAASDSSGSESFESQPLTDGVYLYGETEQPNQIGAAYMVMQVEGDQVVGAFYLPRSSFDCFQGAIRGDELDLTIVNSYDRTTHDYSLAVQNENFIASIDDPVATPARLNGMYHIPEVSDNDQRMLSTCKADFQAS